MEWTDDLRQVRISEFADYCRMDKCSSALKENSQFFFSPACLENGMCKSSFLPGQRNGKYSTISLQCSEQVLNWREPKKENH